MGQIIGWIAWGLVCFFAVVGALWANSYVKRGGGLHYATLNTIIILWFLAGWAFHYSQMNKLHLLWLAPLAFPLSSLVTIRRTMATFNQRKMFPPGMIILLAGYIIVLIWLTPGVI